MRLVLGPLVGLSLSLALLPACGEADGMQSDDASAVADAPAPSTDSFQTRVEVARIEPSDATLELSLPAEVDGARDALLASPTGGFVERVYVEEGDEVRRGQPIAAIDRRSAAARRDQALAQLDLARSELERVQQLGDLASPQQHQQAETQVAIAKAAADLAEVAWQRALITAPFDGVVGQVGVEEGEVAAPAAPVARLVQLDPVEVSVSVSDRDVVGLRPGMPVVVETDAHGTLFDGELVSISPAADLKTRSFLVKARVPNPDHRLLPGMIARVSLSEPMARDAVVIPQEWLVTRIDGIGVFVVDGEVARWRPVKAGAIIHDQILIEEGLAQGDTVVITGQRNLADGDPLLIARSGTCCVDGRPVF
ncbi:MAG: efflux RND transporter periplasmic adaptor subunit [Deltaproteobacteria bacterium]|nr:MAG: efflux RND transporter periplasmic adaptor subunit [Deltaproteobacteria bacterium]